MESRGGHSGSGTRNPTRSGFFFLKKTRVVVGYPIPDSVKSGRVSGNVFTSRSSIGYPKFFLFLF